MRKIRILVADDHPVVRDGLKALVKAEHDLELVGEAADGDSACRAVLLLQPDVVLMDLSMPGLGGAEATSRLKETSPEVRVLALTAHEDAGYVRRLLDAGACGYVLKRAAPRVLVDAIRSVAQGGMYLDPAITASALGGAGSSPEPPTCTLSSRETGVLRLIAEGYSNKEVAVRLGLSVKTVETYKARSMKKLDLDSRVDLVRYAIHRGWLSGS